MEHRQNQYPMKALTHLTGLPANTVRAWERRYGAITPARSDGSRRLYSDDDVERLRLLKRVVDAGHGIGRAARLSNPELIALVGAARPPADDAVVERVLAAIARYDHLAADRELTRAATLMPPSLLVSDVVQPLAARVGEGWANGTLTIGQEHMTTALLRALLGTLLRLALEIDRRGPLVLATLPGERHELGLLMVALLAATRGVPVCYLGPDIPPEEIVKAARITGARAVGLSMVRVTDPQAASAWVADLATALPPGVPLWLGGPDVGRVPVPAGARALASAELEGALDALSPGPRPPAPRRSRRAGHG